MVVKLCGWKLLIVSHHLAKSGSHRHCCSGDITDLKFHVTLQDSMIKGLCEFMEESTLLYIPKLPSSVDTAIVVVDI